MCIFKNKNAKYFKSPSTVHHENLIFRKIKKSCNTKTLWKQFWGFLFCVCFDQKHTYNTTSASLTKYMKIIKSHGNCQSRRSFGYCIRCVFAVTWFCVSWRFVQRFENQHIVTKPVIKQWKTLRKTTKIRFPQNLC